MTPRRDHAPSVRVRFYADGSSEVDSFDPDRHVTLRTDRYPASAAADVLGRFVPQRPHVLLLDQIEADIDRLSGEFPELLGWTRSRHHFGAFGMLHLHRGEQLVNVFVTRDMPQRRETEKGKTVVYPARAATIHVNGREFRASDLNGVYSAVLEVVCR